jgi:hypothetical protein
MLWWCLTSIVMLFGCLVPRLLTFSRGLGKERSLSSGRCGGCVVSRLALYRVE